MSKDSKFLDLYYDIPEGEHDYLDWEWDKEAERFIAESPNGTTYYLVPSKGSIFMDEKEPDDDDYSDNYED